MYYVPRLHSRRNESTSPEDNVAALAVRAAYVHSSRRRRRLASPKLDRGGLMSSILRTQLLRSQLSTSPIGRLQRDVNCDCFLSFFLALKCSAVECKLGIGVEWSGALLALWQLVSCCRAYFSDAEMTMTEL